MKISVLWGVATVLSVGGVNRDALAASLDNTNNVSVLIYAVGKKVSDFPTNEDMSKPEAAYATINRAKIAEGPAAGARLSVAEIAARFKSAPKEPKPMPAEQARSLLAAQILEVQIVHETNAAVFARIRSPKGERVDYQSLQKENGRWLNRGNDGASTLEEARKRYASGLAYREAKRLLSSRPAIVNPEEHLRPFVDFLRREAKDPQEFLLKALAERRVVILGEVHHRPRYWAFNASLVRAKEFVRRVGVIYLELPCNDQSLVDQFLAASKYDPQRVIEMLRDMLWMGWPDQPMLDFFQAVWEVNQTLPPAKRLRIVLVDMARPWKEIHKREDWRNYHVDRDEFMAENVARDLREHSADPRHALFIVGCAHAMVQMTLPGGEPVKKAGWHLREELGDRNVFAVFPHKPVMSNMGKVNGRIALGLFETAFAALNNKPMVFPLDHGPFGEQVFDASLDCVTTEPFRNGYHAYLYLGPLEDEIFSPLIPGFYTDEFVKELDRRNQAMYGKGLVEAQGVKKVDAESFIQWMKSWGQPRSEWSARSLGPLDAWRHGSDWKETLAAANLRDRDADKVAIRQTAARLIDAIRKADYEHPGDWREFPSPAVSYRVNTDYPAWVRWVCQHFRTNPIVSVQLGEVYQGEKNRPTVSYKLTQLNGEMLQGNLPFGWDAREEAWYGREGLDWHRLKPRNGQGVAEPPAGKTDAKQRLLD